MLILLLLLSIGSSGLAGEETGEETDELGDAVSWSCSDYEILSELLIFIEVVKGA